MTNIKTNICVFAVVLLLDQKMVPVPTSAWFLLNDNDIIAAPQKYVTNEVLKYIAISGFQST